MPTNILEVSLAQLIRAELIQQRGAPPLAVYTFGHALIQEVAYQSLLKSRRRHCTRRSRKPSNASSQRSEGQSRSFSLITPRRPVSLSWQSGIGSGRANAQPSARQIRRRSPTCKKDSNSFGFSPKARRSDSGDWTCWSPSVYRFAPSRGFRRKSSASVRTRPSTM